MATHNMAEIGQCSQAARCRNIFLDKSGFRADVAQGRTCGAKAQTPVVFMPGKRQSMSVASAINAKGGFWFMTYTGSMTATLFLSMLRKLMRYRKKMFPLVLDNLSPSRSSSQDGA